MDRRSLLKTTVGVVVSGSVVGCTGDDGGDDGATYVPNEPEYRKWFKGVSNYKGTVEARGQSEVTIDVGVQGNNGYYKFGPAAIAISPGTEVTWQWTGRGGTHNVHEIDDFFDSGELVDDKGHTYQYTFDQPGIFKYVCDPHRSLGMKGAVFVALGDPGS